MYMARLVQILTGHASPCATNRDRGLLFKTKRVSMIKLHKYSASYFQKQTSGKHKERGQSRKLQPCLQCHKLSKHQWCGTGSSDFVKRCQRATVVLLCKMRKLSQGPHTVCKSLQSRYSSYIIVDSYYLQIPCQIIVQGNLLKERQGTVASLPFLHDVRGFGSQWCGCQSACCDQPMTTSSYVWQV